MTEYIKNHKEVLEIYENVKKQLNIKNSSISSDIKIYTMTMEAKIDATFYPLNILNFIKRDKDNITNAINKKNKNDKKNKDKIKTDNIQDETKIDNIQDENNIDNIGNIDNIDNNDDDTIQVEKKNSTVKGKNKFQNQVTLSVNVSGKDKDVSVKVFNNGRFHFTGCLNIETMLEAIHKVFIQCSKERAMFNPDTNKIEKVEFVDDVSKLQLKNLTNFQIDMINCGFKVPFEIQLDKLKKIMIDDGYNIEYDTINHSGLKVLYSIPKKLFLESYNLEGMNSEEIECFYKNIFNKIVVFNSGSISIIIGKQRGTIPIESSYEFIYKYLLKNQQKIVRNEAKTISAIESYLLDNYISDEEYELDNNVAITNKKIICKKKDKTKKYNKTIITKKMVHDFLRT
jgi:hypothetical protein